ncbi:hypothetical protein FH968_19160 [Buttiauxella sp. B2]|nr:hypothetical protein FH968_19160 [Buttiauxella sp. B2]
MPDGRIRVRIILTASGNFEAKQKFRITIWNTYNASIFTLMGVALRCPDYTCVSKCAVANQRLTGSNARYPRREIG